MVVVRALIDCLLSCSHCSLLETIAPDYYVATALTALTGALKAGMHSPVVTDCLCRASMLHYW